MRQPALVISRRQIHVHPVRIVDQELFQERRGEDVVGVAVERALLDVGDVALERVFVVLGQRKRPDALAGGDAGFD